MRTRRSIRLKHATQGAPIYGLNVSAEEYRDEGVRLLRTTDISDDGKLDETAAPVFVDRMVALRAPLETDDLLLSRSGTVGRALRVREDMLPVTHAGYLVRFRPDRDRMNPSFLEWAIRSQAFQDQVQVSGTQSTIINVNAQRYATMAIPNHPMAAQQLIVDFLDQETQRIDALVHAKRRMIDLLEEKLATSITFGTWLDAPMTRLRFHTDLLAGYAFSSEDFSSSPDDIALLRGTNVGVGVTRWDEVVYWPVNLSHGLERYRLERGDIILGLDRPWIAGGIRVATIQDEDLPALLLQRVLRIRARPTIDLRFIYHLLRSRRFLAHFEPDMTGISVPHISPDQVGEFAFPLPNSGDQVAVATKLDRLASATRQAVETVSRQIARLSEYREALITKAVTGQLDEATLKGKKPADEVVSA